MGLVRIIVATAAVGSLLAACSSDSATPEGAASVSPSPTPSKTTTSSSSSESSPAAKGATVETAKVQDLGKVLVNEDGLTLYLFTNDTGTKSTCTGDCAATWPALTTDGKPVAGSGADDSKLGTTGSGGDQQVTYDGHPLYLFSGDSKAGEANGQGIGGIWFAVTPDGEPAGQG
jgi:predicted lipoprotein with Yx(FWY)xxD motif